MSDRKRKMMGRAGAPKFNIEDLVMGAATGNTGTGQTVPPDAETALPLVLIWPDPIQPRRAMPETLRAQWCDGTPIEQILAQWERQARQRFRELNEGADPEWDYWLRSGTDATPLADDLPPEYRFHPDTRHWVELLQLAGSILEIGLEQPITVYEVRDDAYRVQAGERRLLAYHLLHWQGADGFDQIPAILREQYDPFRQALENGARQDLNAIGLARQLALVLMALNSPEGFIPPERQMGLSFYAQASDQYIPKGKAEAIAHMLGVSSVRQLQRYKKLLDLPPQVWNWADQFDWPEGKLRGWVNKAKGNHDQLVAFAQEEVTRELGQAEAPVPLTDTERAVRKAQSTYKAIRRVAEMSGDELRALPDAERQRLVQMASDLIRRLK
jgi:hypothetical protein